MKKPPVFREVFFCPALEWMYYNSAVSDLTPGILSTVNPSAN